MCKVLLALLEKKPPLLCLRQGLREAGRGQQNAELCVGQENDQLLGAGLGGEGAAGRRAIRGIR